MSLDLSFFQISALTLLGVAIILSFYLGFLAKQVRLPSLIGYMVAGLLLGPACLNLFSKSRVDDLAFLAEIGLGFVAFTIGSELSFNSLKRLGTGIVLIILSQSFISFLFVTVSVYLLTKDLCLSVIFGAMAPASAPAGTVAVIQEVKAEGTLTKALYAVVGFDDGLAVIIFGFAAAWAKSLLLAESGNGSFDLASGLVAPLLEIGLSIVLGVVLGFLFCQLVGRLQKPAEILIMIFGTLLLACGLASRLGLSLILTNLLIGLFLANARREVLVQRVREPLLFIMPLVFILFFCLAGAHLQVDALQLVGMIGVVYIISRSLGKMGGAWFGAVLGGVGGTIKKYLGLGTLSQAGVAIGLALIVQHDFKELAGLYDVPRAVEVGCTVLTTVTATSVFFEILGPICTRFALIKSGESGEKYF